MSPFFRPLFFVGGHPKSGPPGFIIHQTREDFNKENPACSYKRGSLVPAAGVEPAPCRQDQILSFLSDVEDGGNWTQFSVDKKR